HSPRSPPTLHSFPTRRSSDLFGILSIIAIPLSKLTGSTLLGMALMAASVSSEDKAPFIGRSVTRSGTIHLKGPIAKVFPLFEPRSEEHTSELQSRGHLVCRLL